MQNQAHKRGGILCSSPLDRADRRHTSVAGTNLKKKPSQLLRVPSHSSFIIYYPSCAFPHDGDWFNEVFDPSFLWRCALAYSPRSVAGTNLKKKPSQLLRVPAPKYARLPRRKGCRPSRALKYARLPRRKDLRLGLRLRPPAPRRTAGGDGPPC